MSAGEGKVRKGLQLGEGKFGEIRYSEGGERRGKGRRLTKEWEPCTFDVLLELANRPTTYVVGILVQGTGRETSVLYTIGYSMSGVMGVERS